MSWLNLNESLNSLKGQITNFATEVLSDGLNQVPDAVESGSDDQKEALELKCQKQEEEIANLKKANEELQDTLQRERLSRKNGIRDEESNWYWDPPSNTKPPDDVEKYKTQIQELQDELANLRERDTDPVYSKDGEEELNRLREENRLLTSNLEDLDNQHQLAMDRLLTLKRELQKNFEVLKQEHEDLKNTNDEYTDEVRALDTKLKEKDRQIHELMAEKSDYDTLHHKYLNLEKVHGLLRENAEKFQEENQELHEEVFKLQEQVTKLDHDIEIATKNAGESVPRQKYEDLLQQYNEIKERRMAAVHFDEVNIDDNAKSVIENLKRDINELQHKLSSNQDESKVVRNEKIIQLYNKYVNFELPVDCVGEMPTTDDNIALYKLESVFKTLHAFKKDIDKLEHNLSEKTLNVKHLTLQIEDLTAENDFLTTDVHHFEKELNDMKKNNDFLISEIAALKNTSKLEPIIETHEDNLVKLENELADCNKINRTFESEIRRIEKELEDVRTEKSLLQTSLNDLKEKYTAMIAELDICKTDMKALNEMERAVEGTRENEIQKEIEEYKSQINTSNNTIEKLSIDMHIIENEKVLLAKEADDLKHDLSDIKKKCAELEKQVAFNQGDVDNKNHETEVAQIRADYTKLNNKIQSLTSELDNAKKLNQELSTINASLSINAEERVLKISNLEKVIADLNSNLTEQETLKNEIINLELENKDLVTRKLQLETDFNNLLTNLQERDAMIDGLNATIAQNDANLLSLKQNVVDLENSLTKKNQELIENNKQLQDTLDKLKDLQQVAEESKRRTLELDSVTPQIDSLKKEVDNKNTEVLALKERLHNLEKYCETNQTLIEEKDKKINDLSTSLAEIENSKINNTESPIDDEKHKLTQELMSIKHDLIVKEQELIEAKTKLNDLELAKENIDKLNAEKAELINLVSLKHNESIQYHNEIQRLNKVILDQSVECKKIIENQSSIDNCGHCNSMKVTLKEKDEIIKALNDKSLEYDKVKAEFVNASENLKVLVEKCDYLEKTLAIQNESLKRITAENVQLSERESTSTKELDRLRQHLVELEDTYTNELMNAEQKLQDCQTRLQQVEERAKQTSTVYTSNSIRANQEVETLRNQMKLVERQRDEVQARLAETEDSNSRSEAALINLQLVLQQFQSDKERDIELATEKIRGKMADLRKQNEVLQLEINGLNSKLEEALAGLQAATRLGNQLETKTAMIGELKEQINSLQLAVASEKEKYHNATSNQQDRVDKSLVKNLVVNYVTSEASNSLNKTQVLRILSTVLDFNQSECEKLGLSTNSKSTSLAREFIRFLEKESTSRSVAIPSHVSLDRKNSIGPHQNPTDIGHKRNPSSGSNNLLFQNLDNLETSSQISVDSTQSDRVLPFDTGVNQVRNTEGAILKHVLKDIE